MALFGMFKNKKEDKALEDIKKAISLIDEEKWDEAIVLLKEPVSQGYVYAMYYTAVAFAGKKEYDAAVTIVNRTKNICGNDKELEEKLNKLNSDITKLVAKREEDNRIKSLEDSLQKAISLFNAGKLDEAINLWKEPAEKGVFGAMVGLVQAYVKKENYDEALKWLDKIPFYSIDEKNRTPLLYFREFSLAKKYRNTDAGQKAIKLYNKASTGDPRAQLDLFWFYLNESYDQLNRERHLGRKWIIDFLNAGFFDSDEKRKLYLANLLKELDAIDDCLVLAQKIKQNNQSGSRLDEELICKHYPLLSFEEKEYLDGVINGYWENAKLTYYDVRASYCSDMAKRATNELESLKWLEKANDAISQKKEIIDALKQFKEITDNIKKNME